MTQPLTPKQDKIYRFIQSYLQKSHVSPSLREIGAHFGIAPGTVQDQLIAIEKKGYLNRNESRARGLHLPASSFQIPILGRVHAGDPHTAFENVEGHVPGNMIKHARDHFALRVRGDSMINAGIQDGDIAIVRKQPSAENGDIVVAMVDGDTTVKYLRHEKRKAFLEPANPRYAAIRNPEIVIIGKVVETRRAYE